MNCMEFRRLALTEAKPADAAYGLHLAGCAACQAFHARVQRLNGNLRQAVEVPVPAALQSRIRLRQSFAPLPRMRLYAMAAGLLAAVVGLGVWMQRPLQDHSLQMAVISHAMEPHEPALAAPVPPARVNHLLAELGGGLKGELRHPVVFSRKCRIDGHPAAHLMVETPQGPVTVFLMPASRASRESVTREGEMQVRIVSSGPGAMALVAPRSADLEPVAQDFRSAVAWSV